VQIICASQGAVERLNMKKFNRTIKCVDCYIKNGAKLPEADIECDNLYIGYEDDDTDVPRKHPTEDKKQKGKVIKRILIYALNVVVKLLRDVLIQMLIAHLIQL